MATRKNPEKRVISHACMLALALAAAQPAFAQQSDLERKALDVVAARIGASPDALKIENLGAGRFAEIGVLYYSYKVGEAKTGQVYPVSLAEDGSEIDIELLQQREQDLYVSRYGKLDRRLVDDVATRGPKDPVEVTLWLRPSRDVSLDRPAAESKLAQGDVDALYARLDAERSTIAQESIAAVLGRLDAEGFPAQKSEGSTTVSATIPAGDLRRIGDWDEVATVYLDERNNPDLSISGVTTGAYSVHAAGNTGQGVRVAQVEVGGLINTANPWLAGITQNTATACYNNHGTNVAGVIRSTNATQRGFAPSVLLWAGGSCGGNSSQLRSRSNDASAWGARAQNLSWGADTGRNLNANDRFYDDMVQNGWRTIVVSAGNNNPPFGSATGNVGSPALAYNVIAVGAVNDRVSPATISNFSSWRDPNSQHGDREKPEIAAPGTNIQTTSGNGLGSNSGTSFSAPMVTGTTALMMHTSPALGVWPEAVKAILMATATNNVEGGPVWSEFDGAGGINADRANRVAGFNGGTWSAQGYSCSAPSQLVVSNVFVNAGRRTRVAMVWDTNPTFWNFSYGSRPGADLDMQIIGPLGNVVASSLSWDNTYEIVQFTAPTTGTYRLRVNKFRCNHTPKWLGWAWDIL